MTFSHIVFWSQKILFFFFFCKKFLYTVFEFKTGINFLCFQISETINYFLIINII